MLQIDLAATTASVICVGSSAISARPLCPNAQALPALKRWSESGQEQMPGLSESEIGFRAGFFLQLLFSEFDLLTSLLDVPK
jgi:hypothetical protein